MSELGNKFSGNDSAKAKAQQAIILLYLDATEICVTSMMHTSEASLEEITREHDGEFVAKAQEIARASFQNNDGYDPQNTNAEKFHIETQWPLHTLQTVLLNHGVDTSDLNDKNINAEIAKMPDAFFEELLDISNKYYNSVLCCTNLLEEDIPQELLIDIVDIAKDTSIADKEGVTERFMDGKRFSIWFAGAREQIIQDKQHKDEPPPTVN